ncbi:hypothetical protein [Streptomyces sp. NBC_01435]|uniref:hypothetical protein n=1 Tax=Streptomyces sp. NBC_01435 TaxID=2903865 RepID=UPI002E34F1E1|nr:hypothetical protein [Streptomyces sp. NBC_01435]
MLRITDTRTGHLVEIPAAPRRLLRSRVHLPAIGEGADTGIGPLHLRIPLIGDVLARTAELNGLQVVTVLTTPELTPGRAGALDRVMAVLGIHPPVVVGAHRPDAALGGPADVQVVAEGTDVDDARDGARIEVAGVAAVPSPEGVPDPGGLLGPDLPDPTEPEAADPLAVRLLLLGLPYGTPVTVTGPALAEARRTLREWRRSVADWAQEPSRPVPADLLRQAHAAFAEDLDVAAVLGLLAEVAERSDLPSGAKFETFAHLDRVLGLDLARDVGHQR